MVAQLDQRFKRPARRRALLEGDLLGIVELHQVEQVEAEPLEGFLNGAADTVSGEVAAAVDGVHLGGHHDAVRQAARLRQSLPDPSFAVASAAVLIRGIDEVEGAFEDPADQRRGQQKGPEVWVPVVRVDVYDIGVLLFVMRLLRVWPGLGRGTT